MTIAWINLSTRWSLTSVQATLNVIISVLGTVGIWSFSRYWWQRGCARILRDNSEVPLPALCTIASPGEGWDVVAVLRRRLFSKESWRLLVQLVVVIAATLACMLSGPIAKVSLRRTRTVQTSNLEVLQTSKGDGFTSNLLEDNVLWNDTIQSLNQAGFPTNQLLDYLPPSIAPWTYVVSEWNPTWSMTCNYTTETVLHNVTSSGNYTFYDPINAFPTYRDTYDPSWLDTSKYRMQADFESWTIQTGEPDPPFTDVLFFILVESDPEIDDRMYTNNETIQMSMSILHTKDFRISNYDDVSEGAATTWRPLGPVGNASFSRVECTITRKPEVADENAIPWPWTNNTYSITMGYRTYWDSVFQDNAAKSLPVLTPTPEDILRFYQAYFATADTIRSFPSLRKVSVWMDTVQLSVVFLAIIIILAALTLWQAGRYFLFMRGHKSKLGEIYIPDGKMEWMIHAAKTSADGEEEMIEGKKANDRDYFRAAIFGYNISKLDSSDPRIKSPGLARVYANRTSISGATPSFSGSASRGASNRRGSDQPLPPFIIREDEEFGHDLKQIPSSVDSKSGLALNVSSVGESSQSCSRDHSPHSNEKMLNPQISRKSSTDGSRPSVNSSFLSIVPEMEEVSPTSKSGGSPDEER